MGPEGGRPGRTTQAVRHTCSGKLGIVKILRYNRSDMYTASSTHNETVKLDKKRTDRAVITVNIM